MVFTMRAIKQVHKNSSNQIDSLMWHCAVVKPSGIKQNDRRQLGVLNRTMAPVRHKNRRPPL